MIMEITVSPPLTPTEMIFLSTTAHQIASEFCQHQPDPRKAEQVYGNTLAVWAVHEWLQAQGIETDLAASDSWDVIFQTCSNVADLVVPGWGRLECRAVVGEAATVAVPPETWDDRQGYIVVQLDETLETATLIGFVETVQAEVIPLDSLQDLRLLRERLPSGTGATVAAGLTHLSDWVQNQIDQGWQTLEALLHQPSLALNARSETIESDLPVPIRRGKFVTFAPLADSPRLVLLVEVQPQTSESWAITVSLGPEPPATALPRELTLAVLDEAGSSLMQAQSRRTEHIALEFRGEVGDRFSTRIALGELTITEAFVI